MTETAPRPDPIRRWSTDVVAAPRRLDYWVGAICEAFLEMDCSSRHAAAFDGALASLPVGPLSLNQVRASTQDVYRTPAAITRGRSHPFYLITQSRTAWHVRQGGHVAHLRPGDAVLVDSAQRYELHFPDSVACLSIQLPRAFAGRWLRTVDADGPRVAARDAGWGRALSALCLQLGEEPALACQLPQELLCDQVGAMLAAALEPQPPPSRAAAALAERAQACMRQRLDESGLAAGAVAQDLGVSARTLHRAFASLGTTFGGRLRELRVRHAAELLGQPRLAALTVAEIGRRCGWSDASHFGRDFQALQRQTPAAWRRGRLAR